MHCRSLHETCYLFVDPALNMLSSLKYIYISCPLTTDVTKETVIDASRALRIGCPTNILGLMTQDVLLLDYGVS